MADEENPDIYICSLLTQMVIARQGDVRREFQAVAGIFHRLRGYSEEQVLLLLQQALALDEDRNFDALITLCKEKLSDEHLREAIGLLAYLARVDGEVSDQEEQMFARLCLGLGVTIAEGHIEIAR